MHRCFKKAAEMNKENTMATKSEQTNVRITRSRAKALGTLSGLPPLKPLMIKDQNKVVKADSKRVVTDENSATVGDRACPQRKKRAALMDITSNCRNTSNKKGCRVQGKRASVSEATARAHESQKESNPPVQVNISPDTQLTSKEEHGLTNLMPAEQASGIHARSGSPTRKETGQHHKEVEDLIGLHVADIDSRHKDPQMCGIYAPDIYFNLRVKELERRPSFDYMEVLQRDITHVMRGILVDWLVEVCDEYMLAPDTLYLAVNLIDRFLSRNYIEKQRLQLVGVTCLLIASKYDEICAPHIEDFCYITDNAYKREEVLQMEAKILNFLGFQLSVPTTKKFLRRFLQAAQINYKVPRVELEFLCNYLVELTLPEYTFLRFLPSHIAASAVFFARWFLDQSQQPWNPTLEHYTNYKALDLKPVVLGLQFLHLYGSKSPLKAIREKYSQPKFKCVATLSAPVPVELAFQF